MLRFPDMEGSKRESYLSYEDSVKVVKDEFDAFFKKIPAMKNAELEKARKHAA